MLDTEAAGYNSVSSTASPCWFGARAQLPVGGSVSSSELGSSPAAFHARVFPKWRRTLARSHKAMPKASESGPVRRARHVDIVQERIGILAGAQPPVRLKKRRGPRPHRRRGTCSARRRTGLRTAGGRGSHRRPCNTKRTPASTGGGTAAVASCSAARNKSSALASLSTRTRSPGDCHAHSAENASGTRRGTGKLSRRPSGSGTCRCGGRRSGSRKARSVSCVAGAMGDPVSAALAAENSPRWASAAGRRCSPKRVRASWDAARPPPPRLRTPTSNGTARPPARPRAYPARHAGCGSRPAGGAVACAERGRTASISRWRRGRTAPPPSQQPLRFSRRRAHGQGATAGCTPSCAVPRPGMASSASRGGGGAAGTCAGCAPASPGSRLGWRGRRRRPFARAGQPPQAPAAAQQLLRTLPRQFPWPGWRRHKVAGVLPGRGPASSRRGPGTEPPGARGCKALRRLCPQTRVRPPLNGARAQGLVQHNGRASLAQGDSRRTAKVRECVPKVAWLRHAADAAAWS